MHCFDDSPANMISGGCGDLDPFDINIFDDACFFFGSVGKVIGQVGETVVKGVDKAVDVVEDTVEAHVDIVEDVAEAASEHMFDPAALTLSVIDSTVVDGVTHVFKPAAEAVWDATEEGWDATKWVGERGVDMIKEGAAQVGPAVALVNDVTEVATFGLSDDVLDVIDDSVLDSLDELTDGMIDIDYDDGGFSADVGIDDVIGVGLSIGEDGLAADSDVIAGSLAMGVGDGGVMLDVEGGVDIYPLPYMSTHLEIDEDGNIVANGVAQGIVPVPQTGGLAAGRFGAGFQRTEDGWGIESDARATYWSPDGSQIDVAADVAYAETEDGSAFSASASGSYKNAYGEFGGGAGYQRIEQDGEVLETFEAEASAKTVYGVDARAEAQYVGIETEDGKVSAWGTDIEVDGLDGLDGLTDDLLGTESSGEPTSVPASSGFDGAAEVLPPDPLPEPDPSVAEPMPVPQPEPDPVPAPEVVAVPEVPAPEPIEFEQAIDDAADIESSVDDLFDGLE